MRIIDCAQGTAEWFTVRMGKPTASCAAKILTPKTGQLSKQSRDYAFKLLAERLLNRPTETMDGQHWMERGKELEPKAVQQLEFEEDIQTRQVGFILSADGRSGASPDRLIVGRPAGCEIKVPAAWTHLEYLLDGHDEKHKPQIQFQCYVADFEEVIFYSWHERMPPALIKTPRDDTYIKTLSSAVGQFNDNLDELEMRARKMGIFQEYAEVMDPASAELGDNIRRDPLVSAEELAEIIEGEAGNRLAWGGD